MIDWRDPDGRIGGEVTPHSAMRWSVAGLAVLRYTPAACGWR
jgi:protein TonB